MGVQTTLEGNPRLPIYPLRIGRCELGATIYVRVLSTRYVGLFTHWHQGHSVYCHDKDCPTGIHAKERLWKGYFAGEIYDQRANLWHPACMELTERCELDMRHQFDRGQVWEWSRVIEAGKKKAATRARLTEECDANAWPAAFDLVPCLRTVYHVDVLDLSAKNPMPDAVMVEPSAGPAPIPLRKASEAQAPVPTELQEQFRKRLLGNVLNGKPGK